MSWIAFSGTGDAPDADIESAGAAGEFAADRAITHNQQELTVQLGEALRQVPQILLAPTRIVLVANGIGKIAREGDEQAHRVLSHGHGKNAARVGDDDSGVAQLWIHELGDASGRGV